MKFEIVESKGNELEGVLEGEHLEEIIIHIGGKYGIRSSKLKATYELQNDKSMACVVRAGSRQIIVMIPLVEEGGKSLN